MRPDGAALASETSTALSLGQTPPAIQSKVRKILDTTAIQEPSDVARALQILGETGMAVLPEFKGENTDSRGRVLGSPDLESTSTLSTRVSTEENMGSG